MIFPGKRRRQPLALKYRDKLLVLTNNNGFTMVESLFVLMIFISMAALFPLIYGTVYRVEEQLDPERRTEWELFVLQLRKELYMSHSLKITDEQITFIQEGEVVSIEKYKEGIRRRVGGRGHEMILQEVSSVQFYPCDSSLCTRAVFKNGEKERAYLHLFAGEAI
ncbi:competence type IV pilus minor pilin ComGF [Bacillus sp. FJAT-27231]|uniref:competence type IV pilus minor pilin ComGF n=1 Tax=Bacillus sp. FJAT-27231 TaxID=1679168 RepID=UPI0018CE1178|nr:competence type IV pilus minor pilin ComGF [Bacillus sp. FJAT-27231]